MITLTVPTVVTKKEEHIAYYESGFKLQVPGEAEWRIPENVDVVIFSGTATRQLLSSGVYEFFLTLGGTSPK
jgi:hypothetical protein